MKFIYCDFHAKGSNQKQTLISLEKNLLLFQTFRGLQLGSERSERENYNKCIQI